ncbi:MAG: DUF4058 family protein [Caldilineaceae bacterium]
MPSPFPGMDPYLEGSLWTTLHFTLAAEIVRQLAPKLRPRYVALPVERFVLEITESLTAHSTSIYPDAGVAATASEKVSSGGAAATMTMMTPPLRMATVIPERVPQVSIEIRDVQARRLVTAIELLSPTNKQGDGYEEYLRKRRQLLQSDTHLIEIDLLRRGKRVPMRQPLPKAQYFVFLSRVEERPMLLVWPISLAQPLPTMPIPLLPGDDDVLLDLQAAFTATYDLLGYELLVDYGSAPDVPLTNAEKKLANELRNH